MICSELREYADAILYDPSRFTVFEARDHSNSSGLLKGRATVYPSALGWLAVAGGKPELRRSDGSERFERRLHGPGVELCFERGCE
ncbi:MAG: hypothetical protein U5N86_04615 [Planctomycetota bacterium]|nr:hypothetical protein [Planctomycetota bacterium]